MATGPSTSQTPYLVPTVEGVTFTSILSAGDAVAGSTRVGGAPYRMAGIPDGLGAFDNGDGTFTVLMNHELPPTSGVVRAHGSTGAFVSRLVVDKNTLAVTSASDLATSVFSFNVATQTYTQGTTQFARLCSADLPEISAFFDSMSGRGTQSRIFMTGEETGAEGRAFAFIATGSEAGRAYELPRLGKFSWENSVANPNSGAKTVVVGTDDATPGQVYLYVGDKQATGNEVERAGLTNGRLFGIRVDAFATETNGTNVGPNGTPFGLQEMGPGGNAALITGTQLQAESVAERVTEFLRPEDGQWDPGNANRFVFVTTNNPTSPSRLWALDFADVSRPELGGTLRLLLDGREGQVMFDNLTISGDGKVILQEDPGSNARLAKVWSYDIATDTLSQLAEHDPARFSGLTPPFTQDEESSGVIDITNILGSPGQQVYLLDVQAHYPFGSPEIVEGGQLLTMTVDRTIEGTSGNDTLSGGRIGDLLRGREGDDRLINSPGNDLFDGGAGTDTLVFSSAITAYQLNTRSGRETISGPEGRDSFIGVERFTFAGGLTIDRGDGNVLVDDLFYNFTYADVRASGQDAEAHYAAFGSREGRDPNAFFDTSAYATLNASAIPSGTSALEHYRATGFREGRDPSIFFDNDVYLARNADVRASGQNPLEHYLQFGMDEGRSVSPAIGSRSDIVGGFDREYYLLANEDVARSGQDARTHFDTFGAREGRNPNAFFDTAGYLAAYQDVARAGVNPLTHYDTIGFREGRDPSGAFDTSSYLAANRDVAAAGIDPLQHYLQFGIYEGRSAFADGMF
jgi:Ca2+-binding RTX toxin-like protein